MQDAHLYSELLKLAETLEISSSGFTEIADAKTRIVTALGAIGLGGGAPAESAVTFTDITTNNASITKHGYLPKLPNDATKFLSGLGTWLVPPGGLPAGLTYATDLLTIGSNLANQLVVAGSTTGNPVTITATGGDADISARIITKGAGSVQIGPLWSTLNSGVQLDPSSVPGSLLVTGSDNNNIFALGISYQSDLSGAAFGDEGEGYALRIKARATPSADVGWGFHAISTDVVTAGTFGQESIRGFSGSVTHGSSGAILDKIAVFASDGAVNTGGTVPIATSFYGSGSFGATLNAIYYADTPIDLGADWAFYSAGGKSNFPDARIAKLGNLTTNGFVKTSGGDGTLSVDTAAYQTALVNSAGLLAALSDETGTGLVVFNTSPTIVTPTIAKLANLSTDGFTKTSGGDGTLGVQANGLSETIVIAGLISITTVNGIITAHA